MRYMIYNLSIVGIFAGLSIIFDRWWIIFFALLFFTVSSTVVMRRRKCDGCGKQSDRPGTTAQEAIKFAEEDGWAHFDLGDRDYCPECRKKLQDIE